MQKVPVVYEEVGGASRVYRWTSGRAEGDVDTQQNVPEPEKGSKSDVSNNVDHGLVTMLRGTFSRKHQCCTLSLVGDARGSAICRGSKQSAGLSGGESRSCLEANRPSWGRGKVLDTSGVTAKRKAHTHLMLR